MEIELEIDISSFDQLPVRLIKTTEQNISILSLKIKINTAFSWLSCYIRISVINDVVIDDFLFIGDEKREKKIIK